MGNNGDPAGHTVPSRGPITCPARVLTRLSEVFQAEGFRVAVNDPYAGGYITTHYGPRLRKRGGFAIQIEINQDLYIEPETLCIHEGKMADIKTRIGRSLMVFLGHVAAPL